MSKPPPRFNVCPAAVHQAITADPVRWDAETTPTPQYIGGPLHEKKQVTDEGEFWLEWGNCIHCPSTIVRKIELQLGAPAKAAS